MTTATRTVTALAAVALTVAGCSGDDSQDAGSASTPTTSSTPNAASSPTATSTPDESAEFLEWAGETIAADPDRYCGEASGITARGELTDEWMDEPGPRDEPIPDVQSEALTAGCLDWTPPPLPPFAEWAAQTVAANPEWCGDVDGYDLLRDAWAAEGGTSPDPIDVQQAWTACPEPTSTPTETETSEDDVVASLRHNLQMMAEGGYCDTYPASGKANTVDGLKMIYPEPFKVLSGDEVYAMLEDICADE